MYELIVLRKFMFLTVYNKEQPGVTYYYTPLSLYNLGVVNQANVQDNGDIKDHMYCHVYHKGVGAKGANNVCSLIIKTLDIMNILRIDEPGGELNIVFDNCSGQNKNYTVLKLLLWLAEMKYFKKVNFVFLIVGHTKNAADRLFNALKIDYRQQNIYTVKQLFEVLSRSKYVTIVPTEEEDFKDWSAYLNLFYSNFKDKGSAVIKKSHIFSCSDLHNWVGSQLMIHVRQSDLPRHEVIQMKVIKSGFYGRYGFEDGRYALEGYTYDKKKKLSEAIAARTRIMTAALDDKLNVIEAPGINIYKQVEMYTKYLHVVPREYWEDELYAKPSDEAIAATKEESRRRKALRTELNEAKRKVAKMGNDVARL